MKLFLLQQLLPLVLAADLSRFFGNSKTASQTWKLSDGSVSTDRDKAQALDWGQQSSNTKKNGQETSEQTNAWSKDAKPWEAKLVWWGSKKLATGWDDEKQIAAEWGENEQRLKGWGDEVSNEWAEKEQSPKGWGESEQATACCEEENPNEWGEGQPVKWGESKPTGWGS